MNVSAASGSANMAVSKMSRSPEGSRAEEAQETQVQKIAEQQKAVSQKSPPITPSPNGTGAMVNVLA